jgi:hypothetical protein
MIRNRKTLVFVLVAVCVLSGVTAQAATAATRNFKSEIENTVFGGTEGGTTELVFNAGTLKCKEAKYTGFQQPKASETLTLVPTYLECEVVGGSKFVTITTNDCSFLLHAETEVGQVSNPPTLDVNCEDADGTKTGPMVISWTEFGQTKCKITIPEQAGSPLRTKRGRRPGSARKCT